MARTCKNRRVDDLNQLVNDGCVAEQDLLQLLGGGLGVVEQLHDTQDDLGQGWQGVQVFQPPLDPLLQHPEGEMPGSIEQTSDAIALKDIIYHLPEGVSMAS